MRFDPREDGLFVGPLGPATPLRPGDRARAVQDALIDGDERVEPLDDGVLVRPSLLRDPRLASLGLQRLTDPLEVRHDRLLVADGYRWIVTVAGARATRRGPWLVEPYDALLDEDQEAVFALSEAVAAAGTRSARLREVAALQRIADRRGDIVLSAALRERVHVGEQIRVSLEPTGDGVRPVPHLLDALDHTVVPMAPDQLAGVALKGLVAEQSLKVDGAWVLTTPGSARNLAITVAAHHASPEDQRRFVQNPTAYLPDDDAFDRDHYAERVIGAGAVERVAEASTAEERDWYGAEVDLVVLDEDGDPVSIPGERVPALHRALEQAVSAGEPACWRAPGRRARPARSGSPWCCGSPTTGSRSTGPRVPAAPARSGPWRRRPPTWRSSRTSRSRCARCRSCGAPESAAPCCATTWASARRCRR